MSYIKMGGAGSGNIIYSDRPGFSKPPARLAVGDTAQPIPVSTARASTPVLFGRWATRRW